MFRRRRYQILTPEERAKSAARRRRTRRAVLIAVGIVAALSAVAGVVYYLLLPEVLPNKDFRSTIDIGGQDRGYTVHLPPRYDRSEPLPLVMVFHGFTQPAADIRMMATFDEVADEHGFIVVYPEGFLRQWQVDAEMASAVDDVAFINALLDHLQEELSVDPARIYAAGFSQGGFFAQRLACLLADRIAAVGTVAGTMTPAQVAECQPQRPMPVMLIHGDQDFVIPYVEVRGDIALGVAENVQHWLALNGCSASPDETGLIDTVEDDSTRVLYALYTTCEDGAEVALYTVEGGGHTWPGGEEVGEGRAGATSRDINASVVLWEFFARHALGQ